MNKPGSDRPRMVESRFEVSSIPVRMRLDELRRLKDGWLDGLGKAPTAESLDWLARTFCAQYSADLPRPYIYPTAEGGVQLEWSLGSREASLEILLDDRSAEWHVLDLSSDEQEVRSLNLDEAESWGWLARRLKELAGALG